MYDLTVIIVTFNSEKHIEKCVDSIVKSDLKRIKYNIIIIDNCSGDKSKIIIDNLQKKIKNIKVIKNPINTGFAKAVNQGLSISRDSSYILLLNPDTVLEKKSISELITCSKKNNAGICGGSTVDEKGRENGSYFRFPNIFIGIFDFTNLRKLSRTDKWHKYFYYLDTKKQKKDEFPVDVVTGGYMLITKSTVEKIGFLDENFFMYLEDVDYCLRARNAGINVFHKCSSKILHIGGASSPNKDKVRHSSWLKSRKVYFAKHFNVLENTLIQTIFLLDDVLILSKLAFRS